VPLAAGQAAVVVHWLFVLLSGAHRITVEPTMPLVRLTMR
jgi:hypothetical protein